MNSSSPNLAMNLPYIAAAIIMHAPHACFRDSGCDVTTLSAAQLIIIEMAAAAGCCLARAVGRTSPANMQQLCTRPMRPLHMSRRLLIRSLAQRAAAPATPCTEAAPKFVNLPAEQQQQIDAYLDILLEWNKKLNLISRGKLWQGRRRDGVKAAYHSISPLQIRVCSACLPSLFACVAPCSRDREERGVQSSRRRQPGVAARHRSVPGAAAAVPRAAPASCGRGAAAVAAAAQQQGQQQQQQRRPAVQGHGNRRPKGC